MEVDISKELETIKTEKYGETVVGGITDALDILVDEKFKTVDLSEETTIMKTSPYGNKIKQSILDSLYKLSKVESVEPVETEYFTTEQPFSIYNNLKRCEIPEGTELIDENAFKDADSLQVVEIPEGVETIGERAFYGCASLNNVTLPEGLVALGSYAFHGCSSLEEIVFPETLMYDTNPTIITNGYSVLGECPSLKKIVIKNPGDLTVELKTNRVKSGRFYDTTTGKYVQQYIEYPYGFNGSRHTCLENLCGWYSGTYVHDTAVETVELPDNMDVIYAGMFAYCENLVNIRIPSSVRVVDGYAFYGCRSITSDVQFRNVEYLGTGSLACTGIEDFDTGLYPYSTHISGALFHSLQDDGSFSDPLEKDINSSLKQVNVDSWRIPNGDPYDESRTSWGFYGCVALERVDFPIVVHENAPETYTISFDSDILSMGSSSGKLYAPNFSNCRNLEYVNLHGSGFSPTAGVIDIPYIDHFSGFGWCAFKQCKKITKFSNLYKGMSHLPPLVSIGIYAFYGSGLTEFYIPPACKTVENYAFGNCKNLTKIDIDPDQCLWNPTASSNKSDSIGVFYGCSSLTSFDIPFKWVRVPNYAFANCTSLSSILFGTASVTSIGTHAFDNTGFTTISLPSTVKTFSESVFANCSKLTSADVSNVTTLSNRTFENCTALTSVTLPSTVTSLGGYFFANTGFTSFTVQSSITTVGQDCFNGCQYLETVTTLGTKTISARAFANCPALTEVNISSSITNSGINQNAFTGCDGVTFNIDRKTNAVSGYATGWGATNFTINWTGTT